MEPELLFSHPHQPTAAPKNTSRDNDVAALVFSDRPRRESPEKNRTGSPTT
jgi:hypothetical protein